MEGSSKIETVSEEQRTRPLGPTNSAEQTACLLRQESIGIVDYFVSTFMRE